MSLTLFNLYSQTLCREAFSEITEAIIISKVILNIKLAEGLFVVDKARKDITVDVSMLSIRTYNNEKGLSSSRAISAPELSIADVFFQLLENTNMEIRLIILRSLLLEAFFFFGSDMNVETYILLLLILRLPCVPHLVVR